MNNKLVLITVLVVGVVCYRNDTTATPQVVADDLKTSNVSQVFSNIQSREEYPEFTDAVSEYLVSVGYNVPKPLTTDEQRKDFANIFQSLAEATKNE